jgi:tRNA modification GTPase
MTSGDTIAAFSSATAPAARIILRLSGPHACALAQSLCSGYSPAPVSATQYYLHFANLRCPAWLYVFRAPHSYTGEDLIEFHLPGNPVLAQLLLDELLRRGARLAEAGEFTARAYFAGKLDLTAAEGVAATIAAGSDEELQAARQLLAGELAQRLRPAMDSLAQTLALVEIGIDFSEEDVTFLPTDEIRHRVNEIDAALARLLNESARFERLAHEPRIVLVGRPNAGKSTLLNTLAGRSRAIVSNIAGTTRDVLSATVDLSHGRVQLIDVAGLEEPDAAGDSIETQMRAHAMQAVESAEHVILIQDAVKPLPPPAIPRPFDLTVLTKSDILKDSPPPPTPGQRYSVGPDSSPLHPNIIVSAHTGAGLPELREALDHLAFNRARAGVTLALNRRHVAAIEEARAALSRTTDRLNDNAAELIALELRESLDALGRVLGSITPDDILGRIFSSFCIGK